MDVEGGKLVKRIPKAHSHSFFCVEGGNKELWSSGHHLKSCREVAFSHDREKLFSISKDKSVHIMDVEGGKLVKRIPKAHSHSFFCVEGGNKELWSSGHHLKSCREVAFSHDREKLFSISKDKSVHIMDVEGGKLVKRIPKAHRVTAFVELKQHEEYISGMAFDHDKKIILTTSGDGTMGVFNITRRSFDLLSEFQNGDLTSVAIMKGCFAGQSRIKKQLLLLDSSSAPLDGMGLQHCRDLLCKRGSVLAYQTVGSV
ncbi:WD repeat-containing protein 55-like [Polyodon spathula]|uniref:WD repeat-containing protein 55-like n=1 Tax=Polyodon spathula TaxID=7913 RepID=UPI001B7DC7B8|nr:WD repeat-containing protein 55-like [Polyodon spathula]